MAETKTKAAPVAAAPSADGPFWMYKGHPLVRCGDTIYYGSLADPFVVMLKVSTTKAVGDLQAADKVIVALMSTDEDIGPLERIQQRCERRGLYNAIDIAAVWLERALKKAGA